MHPQHVLPGTKRVDRAGEGRGRAHCACHRATKTFEIAIIVDSVVPAWTNCVQRRRRRTASLLDARTCTECCLWAVTLGS